MSSGQSNLSGIPQEQVDSLFESGKFDEARRVAQAALESARRAVNGDTGNRGQLVSALETLGNLSMDLGESDAAEALYVEAMEYLEEDGGDTAQVAKIKSSLAGLYDFGQREEEAIPLYEDAIECFESLDPSMKLVAAKHRNNLAMIYKGLGEDKKAEAHYVEAINTFEEAHGRDNKEVAAVYNNLGALYYQSGYQKQAREMHLTALEIRRTLFGEDHVDVAQSHSNLALVLHELEDGQSWQRAFEDSLEILERHAREDLEDYSVVAENYADLLRLSGQEKKAGAVEKKRQKILKKHSGKGWLFSRG